MTPRTKSAIQRWRHRHRGDHDELWQLENTLAGIGQCRTRIRALERQIPRLTGQVYKRANAIRAAIAKFYRGQDARWLRLAFGVGVQVGETPSKARHLASIVLDAADANCIHAAKAGVTKQSVKALRAAYLQLCEAQITMKACRRVLVRNKRELLKLTRIRYQTGDQ